MNTTDAAIFVNLLGYGSGILLYAMLLLMVARAARPPARRAAVAPPSSSAAARLFLLTAALGLLWNLGSLAILITRDFTGKPPPPVLAALAFAALGLLPAVVVHTVLRHHKSFVLAIAAYAVSAIAAVMHFYTAFVEQTAPAKSALLLLTLSFGALIVPLLLLTRREQRPARAWSVVALAVFAVSALHLSHHEGEHYSWVVELIGHHASLPLATAILYQDFRFALADIFLKRALTFVALVALACGLYVVVAAPLLSMRDGHISANPAAVVTLLGLWVATALLYPHLRRAVCWFVDKVILRRADYEQVRTEILQMVSLQETAEAILDGVCLRLTEVLNAREADWVMYRPTGDHRPLFSPGANVFPLTRPTRSSGARQAPADLAAILRSRDHCAEAASKTSGEASGERATKPLFVAELSAAVLIPTTELPQYALRVGRLGGGRQLLSDDVAFLEAVAVLVARRLDALRLTHERCEQGLREQQFSKLATEAELRALRAQMNPHFLFNALTTIGYLIQTSSGRALDTLMRLTELLRGVLRSAGEFVTLGEEVALMEAYLEIERARFEERLRVTVDVPASLWAIRVPALVLQPLVENAVKHGIAPRKMGGEIGIRAWLEDTDASPRLCLAVRDTGVGASPWELARRQGVGINNIEQRVKNYFGEAAQLTIHSAENLGTVVELRFPVPLAEVGETASGGERRRA